jgi:hypothetical protein
MTPGAVFVTATEAAILDRSDVIAAIATFGVSPSFMMAPSPNFV